MQQSTLEVRHTLLREFVKQAKRQLIREIRVKNTKSLDTLNTYFQLNTTTIKPLKSNL